MIPLTGVADSPSICQEAGNVCYNVPKPCREPSRDCCNIPVVRERCCGTDSSQTAPQEARLQQEISEILDGVAPENIHFGESNDFLVYQADDSVLTINDILGGAIEINGDVSCLQPNHAL